MAMTEEREKEITAIVQSISEINEMYRDLATMVVDQVQCRIMYIDAAVYTDYAKCPLYLAHSTHIHCNHIIMRAQAKHHSLLCVLCAEILSVLSDLLCILSDCGMLE